MGPIVVTDGNERAALAVVRSLGRAGSPVIVCAPDTRSLAGSSRFAAGTQVVPDALEQPGGFLEAVMELCRRERAAVLLPVTDAALEAVLPERDRFGQTRIPFPPVETYRAISDKAEVLGRARALGIPVPDDVRLTDPGHRWDPGQLPSFPVVVKPSRSVVGSGNGMRKLSVSYARSPAELDQVLKGYPPEAFPLLVQEHVTGWGEGAFFLRWNDKIVARFAHRRLREKPPWGGVSVYRASIPLAKDVERFSTALLESFDWEGVAMVEFRRSARDGHPYLMEVNGRLWGSLQLAIDAGVDFPRVLVELAQEADSEAQLEYRSGIRSRWWLGDLDHLILRLKGTRGRILPPGSGSVLGAVARFLVPWRPGDRGEVMRVSDPGPGWWECRKWITEVSRDPNKAKPAMGPFSTPRGGSSKEIPLVPGRGE